MCLGSRVLNKCALIFTCFRTMKKKKLLFILLNGKNILGEGNLSQDFASWCDQVRLSGAEAGWSNSHHYSCVALHYQGSSPTAEQLIIIKMLRFGKYARRRSFEITWNIVKTWSIITTSTTHTSKSDCNVYWILQVDIALMLISFVTFCLLRLNK